MTTLTCASVNPASQQAVASELVNPHPSRTTSRAWDQEVFVDQLILDEMRLMAKSRARELVAVVLLPRGVHPYTVFAFLQHNGTVEVVETALYWGMVQGKWVGKITAPSFAAFSATASAGLECSEKLAAEPIIGSALIRWVGSRQETCLGGWFSEESVTLADVLLGALPDMQQTYGDSE